MDSSEDSSVDMAAIMETMCPWVRNTVVDILRIIVFYYLPTAEIVGRKTLKTN